MTARISIQHEDFDVAEEISALTQDRTDIGAIVTFAGCVRADDGLTSLTLEHYPAMTEREIAGHVAEAQQRWPLVAVTVIHRIGTLKPGDAIVLVVTASSHRRAAFEAADFLMDYLKTQAPFWKQEERGGVRHWVEAKTSDDDDAKRWR
ncbi:MAG: molybdenum cofactor biosynthesis protein MoaE [Proteobacteria bacterium]|nr:molybdenum cofactor biosynthesis protein MoaE [Pseudomonadota bacterium]